MNQNRKLILIFLLLIFYTSNIFAFPGMYSYPSGREVQKKDDGTVIVKDKINGNETTIDSSGTRSFTQRDGTTTSNTESGSQIVRRPDGSYVSTEANGKKVILNSDGTVINEDTTNGTRIITDVNGRTNLQKFNSK